MTGSLKVANLSKTFRGLQAISGVSMDIAVGEIVAVVGPNGAGKTTLFNLIAGALAPDAGQILLDGRDVTGQPADRICAAGVARTFQLVRPFAGLSLEDNVMIGALLRQRRVSSARDRARDILARLGLIDRRGQRASTLTLPDRKRLEMARALATEPRILLLDETMAGLRPTEVDAMTSLLAQINRESGLTIVLIEHVMRAVMALAGRVIVLHHGRKIAEGRPEFIAQDPVVIDSYLGGRAA